MQRGKEDGAGFCVGETPTFSEAVKTATRETKTMD